MFKKPGIRRNVFFILIAFGILFSGYFYFKSVASKNSSNNNFKMSEITINKTEIIVEIARSAEEKKRGLSGREYTDLPENQGMLFVEDTPKNQIFWMIDMKFPIDIIWISGDKVLSVTGDVPNPEPGTPDYKLPLYYSPAPVNYVLEVHAGFSEKNNIVPGSDVKIRI